MTPRLFRGKDKKTKQWVEGSYFEHEPIMTCFTNKKKPSKHLIICDGLGDWGMEPPIKMYEVIPLTIGMYTGINDINDEFIFEHDIVADREGTLYVVQWDKEEACFLLYEKGEITEGIYSMNELGSLTVVGNAHDVLMEQYSGGQNENQQ